jgi:hypothetical protein
MKTSSTRISPKNVFTLLPDALLSSASSSESTVLHEARITAGTSSAAITTSTTAMPSAPNESRVPSAGIQGQSPRNWNRAPLGSNAKANTTA